MLIVFSLVTAGCGITTPATGAENPAETASTKTEPPDSAPTTAAVSVVPANDDVIKIGVVATLEGPFKVPGEDGVRGVEMAIAEFGGEIAGKKIELIKASSNAVDPDLAVAAARKLVEQDNVDIVVGPLSGDEGLAVKEYAKSHPEKTFVNGSSGAQDTTLRDPAPNFFRFSTDGAQWMGGLGSYAHDVQGHQRIVTVAEDYSYPYSQVGGFLVEFCRAGGTVDTQFWVPIGTNDYSSVISAIPADIDAIYVALTGSDAVNFLRQYQRFGGKAPLIAGTSTLDQTILGAETVAEYILGTAMAGPVADDNPDPAWQQFAADYQQRFPDGLGSPSLFGYSYYVNAKAALLALEKINGDLAGGQKVLQETLSKLEFDSPTGPLKLDHNRQAIANNYLTVVDRNEKGELYNKLVKTIPNVNQTLGIPEDEYLSMGPLVGGHSGCDQFLK
ncbi:MAG: ABC transporter substrate-binding protein [Rubrivivax sp.]|nr:ABC transporter substrate-binding protein [Rubrivivax sp.]